VLAGGKVRRCRVTKDNDLKPEEVESSHTLGGAGGGSNRCAFLMEKPKEKISGSLLCPKAHEEANYCPRSAMYGHFRRRSSEILRAVVVASLNKRKNW
jgi:hypothetical protein